MTDARAGLVERLKAIARDEMEARRDFHHDMPHSSVVPHSHGITWVQHLAADVLAALADAPVPPSNFAWLIERADLPDKPSGRGYWTGRRSGLEAWTADHSAAIRFARKVDAEAMIRLYSVYGTAIEHGWADAPVPPKGIGCINCGEANDGGYETEEVGPFCSLCWSALNEYYKTNPAVPVAVPPATEGETAFQDRVGPWLLACFGAEIAADKAERNHRFIEEALELVQSAGCTQGEAHQLVDYVFARPAGTLTQEAGGVMVTLAALCRANHIDMHACGEAELSRIWTKVDTIRAKHAAKPKHSPLAALPAPALHGETPTTRARQIVMGCHHDCKLGGACVECIASAISAPVPALPVSAGDLEAGGHHAAKQQRDEAPTPGSDQPRDEGGDASVPSVSAQGPDSQGVDGRGDDPRVRLVPSRIHQPAVPTLPRMSKAEITKRAQQWADTHDREDVNWYYVDTLEDFAQSLQLPAVPALPEQARGPETNK